MNVLVVDVGGSHVKLLATWQREPRRFDSGKDLTPDHLVERVRREVEGWDYDAVSVGYPGRVGPNGRPTEEPGNLGDGWVGYDLAAGFGKPTRVANDAALQALGAYSGGRMLFLGFGTGLGSALVVNRVVASLELGRLPWGGRKTLADRVGKAGRKRYGHAVWLGTVTEAARVLKDALAADHVVLGGGNARRVDPLPEGCVRGGNEDAFAGGFRLWDDTVEHHDVPPSNVWRVVG